MPDNKPVAYKVLPDKSYQCSVCGAIYPPLFRFNAANCCAEVKNQLNEVSQVGSPMHSPHKQGYVQKSSPEKLRDELQKALRKAAKLDSKYSFEYFINNVFERDGSYPKWKGKKRRSPLQRLSYAFYLGSWEMVKHAAYQLAQDQLIRTSFQKWQERILADFDQVAAELFSGEPESQIPPVEYELNPDELGGN